MDPNAPESTHDQPAMRLAVIGNPRSGNTWVRGLLSSLFELTEIAIHRPEDLDWSALPARCIVQIHATREPAFVDLLAKHQVQVVVPARHPFDVLISALNYEQYISDPSVWRAKNGAPRTLRGATPHSDAFVEFATADYPGSLLTISPEWWDQKDIHRVKYEDLVRDTLGTLAALAQSLGGEARRPLANVVAAFTIEAQRPREDVWHYHFFHGRPNLWRLLLTPALARKLYEIHRTTFDTLDYPCDLDEQLGEHQADANWHAMQHESLRAHLATERGKHAQTQIDLANTRDHLDRVHGILYNERMIFTATERALDEARTHAASLQAVLDNLLRPQVAPEPRGRRTIVHAAHSRLFSGTRLLTARLRALWRDYARSQG
jgi:hypothetical protein